MTSQTSKKLSNDEIKNEINEIGARFLTELHKKSEELFPENKRNAWLFRGRVISGMFGNHFIKVGYEAQDMMEKVEKSDG